MPRCFPSLFRLPSKLRRRARRQRMTTLLALLALVLVLAVPFYVIYKPPQALIRYFARRWPDILWQVDTGSDKVVALTIDDAPSEYTEQILEVLEANTAHATFFVIGGQVSGREDQLASVVRAGNELGNHAMHDEPSRALTDAELTDQIEAVRENIRVAYHAADSQHSIPPQYFRPGSGFFSDRMRRLIDALGYRMILGSVYPHDPQISYPWLNAQHILSMVRPGSIIICHDRRGWTAPMLRKVLPELKRRGYRVVTVTELLKAEKK
ncbi:peptidoglycan-N-acetylglucosamine deacetylase [Microdochium nivale]|nr:peptidoglycan-N-acetylglucosamine deacetylase [Microdochium nivale]